MREVEGGGSYVPSLWNRGRIVRVPLTGKVALPLDKQAWTTCSERGSRRGFFFRSEGLSNEGRQTS